jgi:hypothetical protein
MADDNASPGADARVDVARRLIRQTDTMDRLRGWGLLASIMAGASFVAVAGVAPPGWVAIPAVSAVAGGYLLVRYIWARADYRHSFVAARERFALPAAAYTSPRRYFDDHGVEYSAPPPRDPVTRLVNRVSAAVIALALLAIAVLIRVAEMR